MHYDLPRVPYPTDRDTEAVPHIEQHDLENESLQPDVISGSNQF